ncbi:MAG: hypothetical protein GXP62_08055 [Oligoflexia bacterium]|nr:hypothetical protein [Oligoflexia bacterium]
MSSNNDLATAVSALGAIGLGLAGFAALSVWDQKKRFKGALEAALGEQGVGMVAAELGRSAGGGPAWFVTINHPWEGIQSYRADFDPGTDAYGAGTLNALIERLLQAMPPTERSWSSG